MNDHGFIMYHCVQDFFQEYECVYSLGDRCNTEYSSDEIRGMRKKAPEEYC